MHNLLPRRIGGAQISENRGFGGQNTFGDLPGLCTRRRRMTRAGEGGGSPTFGPSALFVSMLERPGTGFLAAMKGANRRRFYRD